jgi:hypothetical protein
VKLHERSEIRDFPRFCDLQLGFFAPETVLKQEIDFKGDCFALGSLISSIFNHGASCLDSTSISTYEEKLRNMKIANLPLNLERSVKQLLATEPSLRMELSSFMTAEYFQNSLINTIKYMENFLELNPVEKAQFLKSLPNTLQQFSFKTVNKKILHLLLEELKNSQMAPFVLPSIFWITERCSNDDFTTKILPVLKTTAFQIKEPPQAALLTLSRLELLGKKTSKEHFRQDILPFVVNCLTNKNHQVQSQTTKVIPRILDHLDFVTVKSMMLPKVEAIFLSSVDAVTQGNSLVALKSMVPMLDKATIIERYLPLFDKRQVEPSAVGIFAQLLKDISGFLDSITVGSRILPLLWSLSSGQVTLKQYQDINLIIDELSSVVRRNRLKQLEEAEEQQGKLKMI